MLVVVGILCGLEIAGGCGLLMLLVVAVLCWLSGIGFRWFGLFSLFVMVCCFVGVWLGYSAATCFRFVCVYSWRFDVVRLLVGFVRCCLGCGFVFALLNIGVGCWFKGTCVCGVLEVAMF